MSRSTMSAVSRMIVVSVISSTRALGSKPDSASASRTSSTRLLGLELASGDVDRHGDEVAAVVQGGTLTASLLEHPATEGHDQPALLEQRAGNGPAGITRRVGCCQRSRASTPVVVRVSMSKMGW